MKLNEPLQIILKESLTTEWGTSENCQVNSSHLINLGYKFLSLPSPPLHIKLSKIQPCPWLHTYIYIYIYISISNNIYLIKRHNYVAGVHSEFVKNEKDKKDVSWSCVKTEKVTIAGRRKQLFLRQLYQLHPQCYWLLIAVKKVNLDCIICKTRRQLARL